MQLAVVVTSGREATTVDDATLTTDALAAVGVEERWVPRRVQNSSFQDVEHLQERTSEIPFTWYALVFRFRLTVLQCPGSPWLLLQLPMSVNQVFPCGGSGVRRHQQTQGRHVQETRRRGAGRLALKES